MALHDFCGPRWVPSPVRKVLFGWFFEASCLKHDDLYYKGGTELDRLRVDLKFLKLMLKDSIRNRILFSPLKVIVAFVFFIAVRLGGWATFKYD